jgi:hypothetical protein
MPQQTTLAVMDGPSILAAIDEIAATARKHQLPPDAVMA